MKAGISSFIASGRHVGKQGGQATHDNDGDAVCIDERAVVCSSQDERTYVSPIIPPVIIYQTKADAVGVATRLAVGATARLVEGVSRSGRVGRRKNLWESIDETLSAPMRSSPLSIFDPAVHKIVEAKKYEQDMADLSLFRERMGQMIEDELAALSDFEDFDETPAVHMVAGADGIFRPNT